MSEHAFKLVDSKLFIENKLMDLPYPVGDVIECGNIFIVRVEPPIGVIFNRNVYAVNRDREILWQIAESPHGTELDKPYVGIYKDNNGKIVAANWNGVDYWINVFSGEIKTKSFSK